MIIDEHLDNSKSYQLQDDMVVDVVREKVPYPSRTHYSEVDKD
jgi:hypothetical protein